jgi:hypothetical protein
MHSTFYVLLHLFYVTHCVEQGPSSAPQKQAGGDDATYLGLMVPNGDMPTVVTNQNPVSHKRILRCGI